MRAKAGYATNAHSALSEGTHVFDRNRRVHSCFKRLTIEYTFNGPPHLVNLVGNQQNECSALHDKQTNMYSFQMRLMIAYCVEPKNSFKCLSKFHKIL